MLSNGASAPARRPHSTARHTPVDHLDRYFQQAAGNPRLSAAEERSEALGLRALRVALWTPLLNHDAHRPAVLRLIADHVSGLDPNPSPEDIATKDRDHEAAHLAAAWVETTLPPSDPIRQQVTQAFQSHRRQRDRFIAANLGLVVVIAKRYERGHLSLADLIQEGNTGLLKAVDRFDPTRGFRFSTYAVWWIRHAIGRALSDKSREIRLPVHVTERLQVLARARSAFEVQHGRPASPSELAQATGLKVENVKDLLSVEYCRAESYNKRNETRGPLEVDELADDDDDDDELDLDFLTLTNGLRAAIEHLPEVQQDVIRRRFGLDGENPMTLREVGQRHHLSRERIRQLQERALATLREEFRERGFLNGLEPHG